MKLFLKVVLFITIFIFGLCFARSKAEGKKAIVEFEISAEYPLTVSIEKSLSKHFMIHPWLMPDKETNILFGYTFTPLSFKQFYLRIGPSWSKDNEGIQKIRAINSECVFKLAISDSLILETYNLAQWSIDDSHTSGLLRQKIKLPNSNWAPSSEVRLDESKKPKFL